MARRGGGRGLSERQRLKFLKALRETGIVTDAAKILGVDRTTVYRERDRNPQFKADWEQVNEWVTEELEQEARRRAMKGSDTLLMFMLRAKRPSVYRESVNVNHGGKVTHEVEEGVDEAINALLAENDRLTARLAELEVERVDQ